MEEEQKQQENKCWHCNKNDATWTINPWLRDLENVEEWEYICDECYEIMLGDI